MTDHKRDRTMPRGGFTASYQAAWDEDDGKALRLLREALPEGQVISVESNEAVRQQWTVWVGRYGDTGDSTTRATIAEAADKCREALG